MAGGKAPPGTTGSTPRPPKSPSRFKRVIFHVWRMLQGAKDPNWEVHDTVAKEIKIKTDRGANDGPDPPDPPKSSPGGGGVRSTGSQGATRALPAGHEETDASTWIRSGIRAAEVGGSAVARHAISKGST